MPHFTRFLITGLFFVVTSTLYSQTIPTRSFHKVIVSQFIEATFIQGDKEQVVIERSVVDAGKLHVTKRQTNMIQLIKDVVA